MINIGFKCLRFLGAQFEAPKRNGLSEVIKLPHSETQTMLRLDTQKLKHLKSLMTFEKSCF